jgi:hypothetical protein
MGAQPRPRRAASRAFGRSLFVSATAPSRRAEDRAIVDAGLKAFACDPGPPLVCDEPAATYERAPDEHGRLGISVCTNRRGLGDKIRLVPSHCDPTANLYDWYVGIRAGCVEQLWPITARGAVYIRSFRGCPMRHVGPVLVIAVICGCGVRRGAQSDGLHTLLWNAHFYVAFVFFALILLHVAAALFHALVRRDGVFDAMAPVPAHDEVAPAQ